MLLSRSVLTDLGLFKGLLGQFGLFSVFVLLQKSVFSNFMLHFIYSAFSCYNGPMV